MSHSWYYALVLGTLVAGIATPQSFPPDLQKYLNLTDAQANSIANLNSQFSLYTTTQQAQYYSLQSQAYAELANDSPDPAAVGADYAQMEMIRRDYNNQQTQLQSKVAAMLTADQTTLVNALLNVERLQPLVSEARCVYLESRVPTAAQRVGDFSALLSPLQSAVLTVPCQVPPMPTALTNYLNLTEAQIAAIENVLLGNQDYTSRQSLKTQELQNDIKDLTAAQTIDSAALGADYLAIKQIQQDESTQTSQLTTTVRSMITDQQQPQLQALDNAITLSFTASEAAGVNILVLPPDLQCSSTGYSTPGFIYPAGIPYLPFPTNSCGYPGVSFSQSPTLNMTGAANQATFVYIPSNKTFLVSTH